MNLIELGVPWALFVAVVFSGAWLIGNFSPREWDSPLFMAVSMVGLLVLGGSSAILG